MSEPPSRMERPDSPPVNAKRCGKPAGHLSVTQRRLPPSADAQQPVQSQPRAARKSVHVVPPNAPQVVPRHGASQAAGGGGEITGAGGGGWRTSGVNGVERQQPVQSQRGSTAATAPHDVALNRWQRPSPHGFAQAPVAAAGGGGEGGTGCIRGRQPVTVSSTI